MLDPRKLEMNSVAEEDLLRMSLTGAISPESKQAFETEKKAGNDAFRDRRYNDAILHYSNAEHVNPLSPIPPANRAMAHLKLSNFQEAKKDSAIALELHNAQPKDMQSSTLAVKILLRRATANFELLLYALAAEDFASVLKLDPANQPAKTHLALLKDKFGILPPTNTRKDDTPGTTNNRDKIQLLSESTNGSSAPRERKPHARAATNGSAHSVPELVELPQGMMHNLVAKWSAEPPHSAFEFQRAWKSLQADRAEQANYLIRVVGAERVANGLFGEGLTPQLLEEIVAVLKSALDSSASDASSVAGILLALTKVARFDMLVMFLSEVDKRPILSLVNSLQSNGIPTDQIFRLKQCYS